MNFEEIKSKIDCRELLVKLALIEKDDCRETIECPLKDHEDSNPSFHFVNDDQYFHCFGCDRQGDVIQLYAELKDVAVEEAARALNEIINGSKTKYYDYCDCDGNLLYQCVRNSDKTFFFRHKENGEWVNNLQGISPTLYGLEKWSSDDCDIIIVEGEKDVETLENLLPEYGITTNPFGAGRWKDEYSELLRGRKVFIIPDNDSPGIDHAHKIAGSLMGIASDVRIASLSEASESGEDVTRQIEIHGEQKGLELIIKAIAESKPYEPSEEVQDQPASQEEKPMIALPKKNRLTSDFTREVINAMVESRCFFRYGDQVVQISKSDNSTEFHYVSPEGFTVDCEEFMTPGHYVKNTKYDDDNNLEEYIFQSNSMTERDARRILKSRMLELLPSIAGILDIPMPLVNNGKLEFTEPGYCDKTGYWTLNSDVNIEMMPVAAAREIIFDLFSEFCFLEEAVDRSIAIAHLLTAALRLLLGNQRAPIILVDGNREGVGKDYLLGIVPLLYTGQAPNYLPPCTCEDEWRKRLYSICLSGERFFLISNLKGHLSSASLEAASTSVIYTDRTLGKSQSKSVPNNAIYCFSGNGVTFSSDLQRRYLQVRLEWYDEDIRQRQFKRDLYKYIQENRSLILSAIYSCISAWVEAGMNDGKGNMPSFDRWAKIVTGIMETCDLGNPFQERTRITASMMTGGDQQAQDMKTLVKCWAEEYGETEIKAKELRFLASTNNLFSWLDLSETSGMTKFSRMLSRYSDRIFNGYRLQVDTSRKQAAFRLTCVDEEQRILNKNEINSKNNNRGF